MTLRVTPSWRAKLVTSKPIILLGEAYGENEAKLNAGFVGASGIELIRMLAEAGVFDLTSEDQSYISRYYKAEGPDYQNPEMIDCIWKMHPEFHRTNVFNLHPPQNKIELLCGGKREGIDGFPALAKAKYCLPEVTFHLGYDKEGFEITRTHNLVAELDRLADEILHIDPHLIVCLGNTPLWALAGRTGVSKLRGTTLVSTHTVSGYKLLAAYHPAAVLRQWELRPITIADFMKIKREAESPDLLRPAREIWIDPTLEDLEAFYDLYIKGCSLLSVDIETAGQQITEIGFAPSERVALVLPFKDKRKKGGNYWPDKDSERLAWAFVRRLLGDRSIRKLFQNGLYDIAFLWRSVGIPTFNADEDTMLLSHALQPESLKGLGFLGSVYTDEGAWKVGRKFKQTIKRDD